MTATPWSPSTAAPPACSSRTCTSGRARSGCAGCRSPTRTTRASGRRSATTIAETPGLNSAIRATDWRVATVAAIVPETPRAATLTLEVPGWDGHRAGQHLDVRLTAEDGYRAQRSYSIGSAPEDGRPMITVEELADGEVSPWFVQVAREGDQFEVRGPFGGWFVWDATDTEPIMLIAGGSGLVPLMSMLRHRRNAGGQAPAKLL